MRLTFNIVYRTSFGEELAVHILPSKRDEAREETVCRMTTADGEHWTCLVSDYRGDSRAAMEYFYAVVNGGNEQRREWHAHPHRVEFTVDGASAYVLNDRWSDMPEDAHLYSSAFTACINSRARAALTPSRHAATVRLTVRAPQLRAHERLALVGGSDCLGAWDTNRAIEMREHSPNEWIADIDASALTSSPVEYKFVALGGIGAHDVKWETGGNRVLSVKPPQHGEVVIIEERQAFFAIPDARLSGTLVPVFSLRSEKSYGIGDFGDLRRMVEWLSVTGQRVLQVLPVNDTTLTKTWRDSYPYSCISVFALHPQYVDLTRLPALSDPASRQRFAGLQAELNALPQLDYEKVNAAKTAYLRELYRQEGKRTLRSAAYKRFFADNEHWLVPYARFCHLRDTMPSARFSTWTGHEQWREEERGRLCNARTEANRQLRFYFFVQYLLDAQLTEVHQLARARGVIIKGDIPIGVSRWGSDVWQHPQYFNLNKQTGAPPDDFSQDGQNWGFPTYNWNNILKDGCSWWKQRLRHMARYFDAYRIDHVLGFFRIWEIPEEDINAQRGQFSPAIAMTREEIESYGLRFSERLFAEPIITADVIKEVFGERSEEATRRFLTPSRGGVYRLNSDCDTQRKIEKLFREENGDGCAALRDGLCRLTSDVLFVRDRDNSKRYHPRICAQKTFAYQRLGASARKAFDRLYDDYYYRRNNHFWYREAMRKLPTVTQATSMLSCAEDLGMVPECVSWAMNDLRILSLELQSMPKQPGLRFGRLSDNPYRSVCTISTHDTPTLRQWWDEDEERAGDYFANILQHDGEAPHPLPGRLARDIISLHLECPSMLCVLPLQDWLAIDERLRCADKDSERVNIPSVANHYWRWRMHITIERLVSERHFNDDIRELIKRSGRS